MVNSEENMKKIKDVKIRVAVRDSRTLTGTKSDNWNGYHARERKINCVTLLNTDVIPGLIANLFSVSRALQNYFQVTSEGKTPTVKNILSIFALTRKWQITAAEEFF